MNMLIKKYTNVNEINIMWQNICIEGKFLDVYDSKGLGFQARQQSKFKNFNWKEIIINTKAERPEELKKRIEILEKELQACEKEIAIIDATDDVLLDY